MARFEFKLPDIGEGVAEGEVVAWHVKAGDVVKEDQPMVEVMTDKATVTIGAPKKGTIAEKALLSLEAPIARVTGFDTPFPYTLENEYLPSPDRVAAAIKQTATF